MMGIRKLKASIKLKGDLRGPEDISAIATFSDYLVIGSDESQQEIQILKGNAEKSYKVVQTVSLPVDADNEGTEIDIEGMAMGSLTKLFVIGSHSLKRRTVKSKRTYLSNRQRISTITAEARKNWIFKLKVDPETGEVKSAVGTTALKAILERDPVLAPFVNIPSKENGVDIEALAADDNTLYLGFRGPVLRGNYVPVMVTEFDDLADYEIRYVDLEGHGIRDMTKVEDGFLLIAGPVGDGFGSYNLFFWDGQDMIPGDQRVPEQHLQFLGHLELPNREAKAEGITVLKEEPGCYQAIVVYDGIKNGGATLLQIDLP